MGQLTILDARRGPAISAARVQSVQTAGWALLVALWTKYNRYLAHVIRHLPAHKLEVRCRIGSNEPVTLRFLAEDYVRHLVHHLEQIRRGVGNSVQENVR